MFFAETVSARKSKGEVLVFKRKDVKRMQKQSHTDVENGHSTGVISIDKQEKHDHDKVPEHIQKQTAIFHWQNVCYDIKIKKEDRRILDHVDGWVGGVPAR